MTCVTIDAPTPRAPTPKVRVMREIMLAFVHLPLQHDLCECTDFRTLGRIVDDAVVADNLLRSLYVEFLRAGRIELQIRFSVNWHRKVVTVESGAHPPETVLTDKAAETATGADFIRAVSPKLLGLYEYVRRRIDEGEYEEANWTIEVRDTDRNKDVARRALALQRKYGLVEPSAAYLTQRKDLEESLPVSATFKKQSLREMLLRVIHRQ
jgi:hypothetical protein